MDHSQLNTIARLKCQQSLLYFTRYFFKMQHQRKFIVNHHHEVIIEAAERVIQGKCKRLCLTVPPRYSKTELMVKMFISHCIANNPKAKFIHLSYSDKLALDNSEEIKELIQSDAFTTLFPGVEIKQDSHAKNKWYTTAGGGLLARSAAGQVTGFGAGKLEEEERAELDDWMDHKEDFGGAIIIDDPIKPEDADSPTIRNKINQRFDSTIRSRVNSRSTPIIIIMQRLHPEDLVGYLNKIEPGEWETISLPAIQEDGTALWPHKHTLEELEELKKANPLVFDRQYMQDPRPQEGLVFHESNLKWYNGKDFDPKSEDVDAISAFIDTADAGDDDLCCPFGFNIGEKIFIHDVVFTTEGVEITVPLVASKINEHSPNYVRIESNMGGSMYTGLLRPHVTGKTQLLSIRAKTNKHTRILTMSGFIKEFCYFREDYELNSDYARFIDGLTGYLKNGASSHDDAPDALTGLCAMIKRFYSNLYSKIYTEQPDGYSDK